MTNLSSDAITEGIRVRAVARYEPEQSSPETGQYLFTYRIVIMNEGATSAKLVSRHWIIINGDGERQDVKGPGVVGETPLLAPGESFEYPASSQRKNKG